MKTAWIACILIATAATARADDLDLASLDDEPNRVTLSTGAEYAFVATAAYSRIISFVDRHIVIGGEATLPWASLDVHDFRVRGNVLVPLAQTTHWKLAAGIAPTVRGMHAAISDMVGLGVDAHLVGGYYTRRWFAALESGADIALTTHVTHSDAYRMNVYADAKDGWYAAPGANLRLGLQLGVHVERYDVILRAGEVRDTGGDPPLIPFYGTLSLGTRW